MKIRLKKQTDRGVFDTAPLFNNCMNKQKFDEGGTLLFCVKREAENLLLTP